MSDLLLSLNEARVLAALVEKSVTTPQYYPMTQNATMLAANQKNSRSPVMNLTEGDTGAALMALENLRLVKRDESSPRAVKWRQQFQHQLLLKPAGVAVLATLMLRGPQTLAEIRSNASVLNGPADIDGVQAALDDLADRAQPLVKLLPRASGQSTVRYAHLLCGEAAIPVMNDAPASSSSGGSSSSNSTLITQLIERVEALEARVAELEKLVS
ncbi:YceH family protein [Hydrocarboniphaga sp.]|uniref:YceH family protein n=1 Tax=Hydrocarboniphaga sp. TaxID=2033016 RepID=UPI003D0AD8E1